MRYAFLALLLVNNVFSNPTEPQPVIDEEQEANTLKNEKATEEKKENDNYRLPQSITPENYKLEIFTHLNDSEGFTFKGIVEITVR